MGLYNEEAEDAELIVTQTAQVFGTVTVVSAYTYKKISI